VTVFHKIHEPSTTEENYLAAIVQEATSIVGPGTLTAVHMLSLTDFFLLMDAKAHRKLRAKLAAAFPDSNTQPDIVKLENLLWAEPRPGEFYGTQVPRDSEPWGNYFPEG
jgi:hypothetical protein